MGTGRAQAPHPVLGCAPMRWAGRLVVAGTVALLLAAAGCSMTNESADLPNSVPTPTHSSTAEPTPTPTPTPTPVRTSPFTGLPEAAPKPVLVVKLDNTRNAQPHAGLRSADIVFIEEVEYGITRIAAVFASSIPDRIGPVRSARITDIDLLPQFGSPAFAFSGAQHKLWPALAEAPMIDISPNKGAEGYSRDFSRRAPYNYFLDGTVGLERAPDASVTRDLGWVFTEDVPAGGMPADHARIEWSYASAGFNFDELSGLYHVRLNGVRARAQEDDEGQNAATVVIQYVDQKQSVYFDKGGGNTPEAISVGTGKAVVLRDGRSWDVTWNRPDEQSGTTFTLSDGSPLPFKPGQTWIVLLDNDRSARITSGLPTPSTATASQAPASATASPSRG